VKSRVPFFLLFIGWMISVITLAGMPTSVSAAPGTGNTAASEEVQYQIYVIQEGDTLGTIARRFHITIAAIKKANNLGNGIIYVGQKLRIPVQSQPDKQEETLATGSKVQPTRPRGFHPPNAEKWIEVDLSQQRLYAHEDGQIVFTTLISSGRAPYRTPIGRFRIWSKVRRQTMSGPGYNLPNVQWVMYFAGENAIHGTYWHNNFGHPMSHGCVNVTNKAARWLYNWAPRGTIVVVHR